MKLITLNIYIETVQSIIKNREKHAEALKQEYTGLSADELNKELSSQFGGAWAIKKEESVKFTKADINAVAGARFFKETGRSLLMGLAIIILGLSVGVKYIPDMTILYYTIYYALIGFATLSFIWVYSRKLSKVRKALWKQIGRGEIGEDK